MVTGLSSADRARRTYMGAGQLGKGNAAAGGAWKSVVRPASAYSGQHRAKNGVAGRVETRDARFQSAPTKTRSRPNSAYGFSHARRAAAHAAQQLQQSDEYPKSGSVSSSGRRGPASSGPSPGTSSGSRRSHVHMTNVKLMEKNDKLRKELLRLQRKRQQREHHGRWETTTHSAPINVQSAPGYGTVGPSASSKTLEIASVSLTSDSKPEMQSTEAQASPSRRPAGSGVQAVRATAQQSSAPSTSISLASDGSSPAVPEAKTEGPSESEDRSEDAGRSDDSASGARAHHAIPTRAGKAVPAKARLVRPASAGPRATAERAKWASQGSDVSSVHASRVSTNYRAPYGHTRAPASTAAAAVAAAAAAATTTTTATTSARPSSAHPRTKNVVKIEYTPGATAERKPAARPRSAVYRSSSSSTATATRTGTAPSTSAASASSQNSSSNAASGNTSQQAERERLQKVITAPEWNGIGRPDMYVFGKLLGQGSFGTVRLAHHKITGHKVAVKSYERARFKDAAQVKRCRQEIQLMEQLNHVHIVRLFEVFETPKRIHLVMEAASGGNLCAYVKQRKRLPEGEAVRIFYHLTLALEYLHDNGIVHRDIKLENVLFDSNRVIKLVDFGFSVKPNDKNLRVFCGTPSYMAPEIVRRKEYAGFPVDIWSLGVLLYAMLCGRFPFTAKTYPDLYKKIARGVFQIPDQISPSVRDALRKMLCLNPAMRLTVYQVKSHRVLTERASTFPKVPSPDKCTHLISEDPNKDIAPPLVKQLVDFGFPRERLLRSVQERRRNHLTTTYYLLAMKAEKKRLLLLKQREQHGASNPATHS